MRIGVDLGGTKIEGIVMDNAGEVRARHRCPTPQGDYAGTVQAIAALVNTIEQQAGVAERQLPVGVGTPGAVSPYTGRLKGSNSVCLINQPLREDLERMLARPVRLANDADCFALSEASDGAAAGAPVVFGVIVGTGCGGGFVVNGQLLQGGNSITGEWGHNPLPGPLDDERPGIDCYCGKAGCIETFISGTGFARDYNAAAATQLSGKQVAERLHAQEPQAIAAIERYENRMARALASIINIVDPHVIVLGGGMSNVARLYENVPKIWGPYVFSDRVDTKLVKAKYGDSSGVRGAAWLWPAPHS
ncbi:N-acetylglucosamine kinase [Magnetococcus marinus MC-1]|uniref:N-acetylglucosamine kinase n=1 Tax=Magnetococcus marinus (strain ATCC BAA-1437 / JCM 17883 / MC-1) TaxID=156889 RepID=A0L665_MAGMM|nr:ROK family protein [Magnetococcus marinus]ABK43458.1 N-acetylglucosamine kinase [Magnetococcus marinus MC-1]